MPSLSELKSIRNAAAGYKNYWKLSGFEYEGQNPDDKTRYSC